MSNIKDSHSGLTQAPDLGFMHYYLYVNSPDILAEAHELASFTNSFTVTTAKPGTQTLYLQLDKAGLAIVSHMFKPLYLNEIYAKLGLRRQNLANELLIQAIKLNIKAGSTVWDLTAGLGKDAFILASFGYRVTMVEQNPLLATILHYALLQKIIPATNLQLVFGDSRDFLTQAVSRPNVIYLDPIFKDNKNAKAKKEMQLIQVLATDVTDNEQLFKLSCQVALTKIIVKRDNKQDNIVVSPKPSYAKSGKTIRFDVYILG